MNQMHPISIRMNNNPSSTSYIPSKLYKTEINHLIEKLIKTKTVYPKSSKALAKSDLPKLTEKKAVMVKNWSNSGMKVNNFFIEKTVQNYLSCNNEAKQTSSMQRGGKLETRKLSHPREKDETTEKDKYVNTSTNGKNVVCEVKVFPENSMINNKVKEFIHIMKIYNDYDMDVKNNNDIPFFIPDLLNFLKTEKRLTEVLVNDEFVGYIMRMIRRVIFRAPKYRITDTNFNPIPNMSKNLIDELALQEENAIVRVKDENWSDILNVYEILIILLNNNSQLTILKHYISNEFLSNLISCLSNYDQDERLIIKLIIHKLYSNSLLFRKILLKIIENKIIDLTYDNDQLKQILGLNEMLELLKCIMLGISRPIKEKYITLLVRVVCPLLKNQFIKYFSNNIKSMIIKISEHDDKIAERILNFLVATWPMRYPEKIILYIEIADSIFLCKGERLISLNIPETNTIMRKILLKLMKSFKDTNFLIADRSLILFKSEIFFKIFYYYNMELKFLSTLIENITSHWSLDIQMISKIVIAKMLSNDSNLFTKLDTNTKKIVEEFNSMDLNENEDIWDIHFNLKAD